MPYSSCLETIRYRYFLFHFHSVLLRQGQKWMPIPKQLGGSIPELAVTFSVCLRRLVLTLCRGTVIELFLWWVLGSVCLHPEGWHLISTHGFCSNKYIVDTYLARSYNDKFNLTVWTVIFIWVKFAKCLLEFCTIRTFSLVLKSAMFVNIYR